MSHRGIRLIGERALASKAQTLKYHWADKNGRMYLCGCCGAFRAGDKIMHGLGKRYKRSKIQLDRWLARAK